MARRLPWLALMFLFAACASTTRTPDTGIVPPPFFEGMGEHRMAVTCDHDLARRYFDQGLALSFAFNHDEAARDFEEAVRLDRDFAMGWWGLAYALGPNYNLWDEGPDSFARARDAIRLAADHLEGVSEKERDLIAALAHRFAAEKPESRSELDRAYADAMAALWRKYPEDADVGALYAEALLQLHPWDQWTLEGDPKHDTSKIVAVLERVLELNVSHPAANHLYIHTMEASQEPQRAEAAADRLGQLVPGAGHIVHMPSHIYMRVGRYEDSIRVNERGAALDAAYFQKSDRWQVPTIYHGYHLHNHHFLVWSAMFQGRFEDALEGCGVIEAAIPEPMMGAPEVADWFTTRFHVLLRFGRWRQVLEQPEVFPAQVYGVAFRHYARGVAFANLGRFDEARRESAAFEVAAARVPKDMLLHVVPAHEVLEVARRMLAGELAFKEGRSAEAFVELRRAVAAEKVLRYTEPNPWMMPTRHALGALLLQEGFVDEAERHYRDDLRRYPENGWSLHGLAECLARRGLTEEARVMRERFDRAWTKATVEIPGSCFCRNR